MRQPVSRIEECREVLNEQDGKYYEMCGYEDDSGLFHVTRTRPLTKR